MRLKFLVLVALMTVCPAAHAEIHPFPKTEGSETPDFTTGNDPTADLAPAATPSPLAPVAAVPAWLPKMKWSGDLRVRSTSAKETNKDQRDLQTLRLRFGVAADVNETTQAILRFATATSAVSTNQTLGDSAAPGAPRRAFGIDWAYLNWSMSKDTSIWLGRTATPFWSPGGTSMIYDVDLAFEGVAAKLALQSGKSKFFSNFGYFTLANFYDTATATDSADTLLLAAQIGYQLKSEQSGELTLHLATHQYLQVKDRLLNSISAMGAVGNKVNGSTAATYTYRHKYEMLQAGVEYKLNGHGVFADYVTNMTLSEENNAFEAGVQTTFWNCKWTVAYQTKESDSLLSAFADNDIDGGGTDQKGWRLGFSTNVARNVLFGINQYVADRNITVKRTEYTVTQINVIGSF